VTWVAGFHCLACHHRWQEPAPDDAWEMVVRVAGPASCPLCGAKMRDGEVELLSHRQSRAKPSVSIRVNLRCRT